MIRALLAATLIASSPVAAFSQEDVKIGVVTTLSGPGGYLGQDVRDGMLLAIAEGNGTLGGVPVKLLVEDDAGKPGDGRQIAERMMSDEDVKIFTGIIFSNVAGATVPSIVDNDAIYISPNAGPSNFAGKGCNANYFVSSFQNDTLHEAAGLAANDLGYKRAFILAPNYQAGKDSLAGFRRTFKGEIIGETYTQLEQTDYSTEMARIRAAQPDVVFQFHPGGLGIAFMRQYQQAGLMGKIPMVLSEANSDLVILKTLGDASIGLMTATHWSPDLKNDANVAFVANWKKTYPGRPVTTYASQGYDNARLIGAALKAAGGDKDIGAVREGLRKADFEAVRGNFSFGPNQHPLQNWYLAEVVKDETGLSTTEIRKTLAEHMGDSYAADCQL